MSKRISIYISTACLATLVLISCAKTGRLYGGPEDKQPPQINEKKSTPNYQTNFSDREIVLVFDEFVEIKNIDKEVLISPPMSKNPKIKQRGKKITVTFDKEEVLREDATYSIQFGESIRDFTAANILKKYKFVFATGDQIDSLSFKGQLKDAYSGKPVEEALVMLYDKLSDSIVAQERPFYLVRTDEEGNFELENIRQDTFKVVALKDLNVNYIYDLEAEGIGFMDSTIMLTDSFQQQPILSMFYEEQPIKLSSKNFKTFGRQSHVFSEQVDSTLIAVAISDALPNFTREVDGDTLTLWYTESMDSFSYSVGIDTFNVYPRTRDSIFDKVSLLIQNQQVSLPSWEDLVLTASAPIAEVDTSKMKLYEYIAPARAIDSSRMKVDSLIQSDSINIVDSINSGVIDTLLEAVTDTVMLDSLLKEAILPLDSMMQKSDSIAVVYEPADTVFQSIATSMQIRQLNVNSDWIEGQKYTISLDPGAVTDIYGRTNDSTLINFTVAKDSEYGNIIVRLSGREDSLNYIVELLKSEETVYSKLPSAIVDSVVFTQVLVGQYEIRLIEDVNNDGKWTTGSYWDNRQPEAIQQIALDKMQPAFDLDAKITWKGKGVFLPEEEADAEGEESENTNQPTDRLIEGDDRDK